MSRKEFKIIYENELGQGIEFSIWSPFFLEDHSGLDGLTNLIYTSKGVSQDGETLVSTSLDKRNIVITGRLTEEAQYHKPRMLSILNPKLSGTLRVIDGERQKYIRCIVEKAPVLSNDKNPSFMVSFLCPNPFFYDKEVKMDIALWKPTLTFPLELIESGIILGYREPSLIVNVVNPSDLECPIKIVFRALGTLKDPSLFDVNRREYFKMNKSFLAGETVTITTGFGNKKVSSEKDGTVRNAFTEMDYNSTFLMLYPGDNLFRYDAEEGLENLEVSLFYSPQYLGV